MNRDEVTVPNQGTAEHAGCAAAVAVLPKHGAIVVPPIAGLNAVSVRFRQHWTIPPEHHWEFRCYWISNPTMRWTC